MNTIERKPVIVLFHVNHTAVVKLAHNQEWAKVTLKLRQRQNDDSAIKTRFTSTSPWSDTGLTVDGRAIASSNALRFGRFFSVPPDSENVPYGDGGTCFYCRIPFEHAAMGIPVTYRQVDPSLILVFFVDVTCCFECTFSWLLLADVRRELPFSVHDSETNLKAIYTLMYPNGRLLQPAAPYRLSPGFEGPLTEPEYKGAGQHIFKQSPHILVAPARLQYIAQLK